MHTFTGYDANNIPRVFGEHENRDVAETACREEMVAYVKRRPDTGPLSAWTITSDSDEA